MTAAEQLHGEALARAYGVDPEPLPRGIAYRPEDAQDERTEELDEIQLWEGEERARLERERLDRNRRERAAGPMTERACSVCGDGMRVPETLRWGWCMWCGCERRIAEALHGDGCDCDRCRTDLEPTGSRCEACGAAPLGGPGDEAALCRDCARALREIERAR